MTQFARGVAELFEQADKPAFFRLFTRIWALILQIFPNFVLPPPTILRAQDLDVSDIVALCQQ